MDTSELDICDRGRGARQLGTRRSLAAGLMVAAPALAACGGSSPPTTPSSSAQVAASSTQPVTPTTATQPKRTSTPVHKRARHTPPPHQVVPPANPYPTGSPKSPTITIPANAGAPAYKGRSPYVCLRAAGLNRARPAREPQVWEANTGSTPTTDTNGIVFLSGPYKNAKAAKDYAKSLLVVELAASGGRWVASASVPSHLKIAVNNVALCMAQSSPS